MTGFTYKSYNFVDKDPMIDQVRTIVHDSHMTYKAISEASGVSAYTIRNWLDGSTRKPQAATVNAVLRTCGHKLAIRPIAELDVVAPTITMRHVVQIAKYRAAKKVKAAKAKRKAAS
jgi:transcriptional regulator with XRE-family HTH domain